MLFPKVSLRLWMAAENMKECRVSRPWWMWNFCALAPRPTWMVRILSNMFLGGYVLVGLFCLEGEMDDLHLLDGGGGHACLGLILLVGIGLGGTSCLGLHWHIVCNLLKCCFAVDVI